MRIGIALYVCLLQVMLITACTRPENPKDSAADCDINAGPCIRQADGLRVTFEIYPRPVHAMREVSFKVLLERDSVQINDAEVTADFTMPGMFMGKNLYSLEHANNGFYLTKGILPRCPKGGKLWRTEVTVNRVGVEPVSVPYLFEVD